MPIHMTRVTHWTWLVGGFNPSEKYESQLGRNDSQYLGKKVPNHQPDDLMIESLTRRFLAHLVNDGFQRQVDQVDTQMLAKKNPNGSCIDKQRPYQWTIKQLYVFMFTYFSFFTPIFYGFWIDTLQTITDAKRGPGSAPEYWGSCTNSDIVSEVIFSFTP